MRGKDIGFKEAPITKKPHALKNACATNQSVKIVPYTIRASQVNVKNLYNI
jgi:hypothetical protein